MMCAAHRLKILDPYIHYHFPTTPDIGIGSVRENIIFFRNKHYMTEGAVMIDTYSGVRLSRSLGAEARGEEAVGRRRQAHVRDGVPRLRQRLLPGHVVVQYALHYLSYNCRRWNMRIP